MPAADGVQERSSNDAVIHPGFLNTPWWMAVMSFVLACRKCGSNDVALGSPANDDSQIACRECGQILGTWGELKARVFRDQDAS